MPKISDLPTDTAPDSADIIPFVDVTASRTESVTVANLAASTAFAGQYAPLAYARSGSGAPNGSVTGNVGDRYIDTAATLGARVWYKASGAATNTGWLVAEGDTGWRVLVSWNSAGAYTYDALGQLSASFAPQTSEAGLIRIRRVNNQVFAFFVGINANATLTANTGYELFAPSPTLGAPWQITGRLAFSGRLGAASIDLLAGSMSLRPFHNLNSGNIMVSSDGAQVCGHVSSETWPSSLPGTAA